VGHFYFYTLRKGCTLAAIRRKTLQSARRPSITGAAVGTLLSACYVQADHCVALRLPCSMAIAVSGPGKPLQHHALREQDLGNDGEKSTLLLPLVPGSQRDGWREALSIRTPNTSKPQSQLVHILVPVLDYAYAQP
jgi:hypothetical protein